MILTKLLNIFDCSEDQLLPLLPIFITKLSNSGRCGSYSDPLWEYLRQQAKKSTSIATNIYWLLNNIYSGMYGYEAKKRMKQRIEEIKDVLGLEFNNAVKFIDCIEHNPNSKVNEVKEYFENVIYKDQLNSCNSDVYSSSVDEWFHISIQNSENTSFKYPFDTQKKVHNINLNGIQFKTSATRPLLIPLTVSSEDGLEDKVLLYKKEDMIKDMVIINIIKLMDIILKRDTGIDFEIITYNVLPLKNSGFIEIVNGAKTLYQIRTELNYTLQNYIMENNPDRTVKDMRNKFAKSVAGYCAMTYLLGVGDRHLDNIMITQDGKLFHIDFGFILGDDPKFMEPHMRITNDMIDALGGIESNHYSYFKQLCITAYNTLRQYHHLFTDMLMLLYELDVQGVSRQKVEEEVMKRFIPSELTVNANLQLQNRLDNYSNSYKHSIIDLIYHYTKETPLPLSGLLGLRSS